LQLQHTAIATAGFALAKPSHRNNEGLASLYRGWEYSYHQIKVNQFHLLIKSAVLLPRYNELFPEVPA